jgi:DNA mismatch endonuclease Vsr
MAGRSPAAVSRHMALIRKRDTRPELMVRRLVWSMGFRYRLYRRDLPGTPDLVFARQRKVILVHGCFWHRHDCSLGGKVPRAGRNIGYRRSSEIDSAKPAVPLAGLMRRCDTRQERSVLSRLIKRPAA